MFNYSEDNSVEEFSLKSPAEERREIDISPQNSNPQSLYNAYYQKKKERSKFLHRLSSNRQKYLQTPNKNLDENNSDNKAKIKTYSIALKSPNVKDDDIKSKIMIHSTKKINDEAADIVSTTTRSPTYQQTKLVALRSAYNLHTSSEKEIALKRILGVQHIKTSKFVQNPTGTLRVYQTYVKL